MYPRNAEYPTAMATTHFSTFTSASLLSPACVTKPRSLHQVIPPGSWYSAATTILGLDHAFVFVVVDQLAL